MPNKISIKRFDTGAVISLESNILSIGRAPSSDIFIDDRDVSRRHATIEAHGHDYVLVDQQSTNGTLLNDWRVNKHEKLRPGDKIVIADVVLEVLAPQLYENDNTSFRQSSEDSTSFRQQDGTSFRTPNESAEIDSEKPSGDDTQFKNPMKTGVPDLSAIPGLSNAAAVLIRHTSRNQIILYTLEQGSAQRWLVGRQRDCDIAIEDNAVSRQHCLIQKCGDRWQIDDQQSRNGTYVNDLAVNMTYLSSGDRVTFGNIDVIFLPLS
ncbi:MAG: FHA domain-containing protein [Halieaceae bacterium]|nr:FHA domain-containing protein [Halieaceae bacterium]